MSDASIISWKHWSWQRVFVPLVAVIMGAYSYWGVWKSHADFTCFLIPFGVALWSVYFRIRARRVLVGGGAAFNLAVRSWHSLDLFSALALAVFETMILTCSCASILMQPDYLASFVILFVIYVGVSGFAQHLLIYSVGQLSSLQSVGPNPGEG